MAILTCSQFISKFISDVSIHQHRLSILVLDNVIQCNPENYFTPNVADFLFNSIHKCYHNNEILTIIYKMLNSWATQLSLSPIIPFSKCTHHWISKNVIKKLKSLIISDNKSMYLRFLSAKLFLNVNKYLHKCTATGSLHLKRIWIGNLIVNNMIHTIKSLIYLKSYTNHQEYEQIIAQIYQIILELSTPRQRDKIIKLSIRKVNININKNENGNDNGKNDEKECFTFDCLAPFNRILIVGDGDFSFTLSFIRYLNKNKNKNENKNVITSCYPNVWQMIDTYPDLGFIINEINELSNDECVECNVLFNIDATKLDKYDFKYIDCIIWNLPQTEKQSFDIDANKKLINSFLVCCDNLNNNNCNLFLTLHCNIFNRLNETRHRWKKRNVTLPSNVLKNEMEIRNQFNTWNVEEICKLLRFKLIKIYEFNPFKLDGYRVLNHLSGTQFKGFNQAFTYQFLHSLS